MKRFILIFFAILVLPILSLTIVFHQEHQHIPTPADSGFDSDYGDYDSGGWDDDDYDSGYGGGYWNDDDDDYYSSSSGSSYSGGGNLSTVEILILVTIMGALISIPFIIQAIVESNKKKRRRAEYTVK